MTAPLPINEPARLANLRSYNILDTLAEEEYEDITYLAAQICGTPISLISLVDEDRQWFKSVRGLDSRETPRDRSFCAHNILDPDSPLVVTDARRDVRFADNPLVKHDPLIVFYAGVPLVSPEGYPLGSLCVIDHEERELTTEQMEALQRLSRQAARLLELRRQASQQDELLRQRAAAYENLRDFSQVIAHDLKAPLRNIKQSCELLLEDLPGDFPPDLRELIGFVESGAEDARHLIDGVLRYSKAVQQLQDESETVAVAQLVADVRSVTELDSDAQIVFSGTTDRVRSSRIALKQILQNLVGNSLKFNDKPIPRVEIAVDALDNWGWQFSVTDNGPGVSDPQRERMFTMFYTTGERSKEGGHGVGLTIVQRLVAALGGRVWTETGPGRGLRVCFTVAR